MSMDVEFQPLADMENARWQAPELPIGGHAFLRIHFWSCRLSCAAGLPRWCFIDGIRHRQHFRESYIDWMEDFEVSVESERFKVSERLSDGEIPSYDFDWLNGPGEGAYGFTVGLAPVDRNVTNGNLIHRLSSEALREEALHFVEGFYELGGVRDEDFPDHVAARVWEENSH